MRYRWRPRWQYLDSDDLLHFFCLVDIKAHDSRLRDKNFPPRLKRMFTRKGFMWLWEGRVDNLEYDDLPWLARLLAIRLPADVVEAQNFSSRVRAHLTRRDDGDYDWTPDMRRLDPEDIPHVLRFFEFSIAGETHDAGNFPARLKSHFVAEEREAA